MTDEQCERLHEAEPTLWNGQPTSIFEPILIGADLDAIEGRRTVTILKTASVGKTEFSQVEIRRAMMQRFRP